MPAKTPPAQLTQLRQSLVDHFNDQELRDLCFDMDIDYESLPGEGKASKARELVAFCERRGQISELEQRVEPGSPGTLPPAPSPAQPSQPATAPSETGADVLLVTVTEVEARAVFDAFTPSQEPKRIFIDKNTYYDLGVHGNARVLMAQSEMGSGGPAGTQATVQASIEALSPDSVVMVGIAFGVNSKKQKIGDILISRQLTSYDLQRVGMDKRGRQKRIPRGDRAHASVRLVDRFVSGRKDWKESEVRDGLILSGDKLVDNLEFLQQLLQFEPEAIGGEMEGAGLYAAAQRAEVDWLLVKAICDWADGNKSRNKKVRQKLAAQNAAQFVLHVIEQGGLARQAPKA
jgi:nucleoside phosphorylase